MLDPVTKEMFDRQQNRPDADDEREWSQFSHGNNINYEEFNGNSAASYMAHRPGCKKRKQTYKRKVSS